MDEAQANEIIMAARAHWFGDEAPEGDAATDLADADAAADLADVASAADLGDADADADADAEDALSPEPVAPDAAGHEGEISHV